MFNSSVLDTLIACVVVILVLSLIVQAVQTGIKKVFKLKSRQIEDSLVDLFQTILNEPENATPNSFWGKSSLFVGTTHSSEMASANVQALYRAVTNGFVQLGRVGSSGKLMLDDLEKDDLLKVLGKIAPGMLLPDLQADVQNACTELRAIESAIESINQPLLSGDTSAKFAALQTSFAPLFNDFLSIANGGNLNPNLLIQDITRLREVKLDAATGLLGEIQAHVANQLAAARQAQPPVPETIKGLADLAGGLSSIAAAIAKFETAFDGAVSPLRTTISEVENWFDTVMKSFDERYTRAMKTWAVGISFVLVVCLNANVFDLYRNVTTNATLRNTLVQDAPTILDKARKDAATSNNAGAGDTASTAQEVVRQTKAQMAPYLDDYANFGFRPFFPAFGEWWKNSFATSSVSRGKWLGNRLHDVFHIIGWVIMTLLLSVGAPFWEDMLESLFGVKNLLRSGSKSDAAGQTSKDGKAPGA